MLACYFVTADMHGVDGELSSLVNRGSRVALRLKHLNLKALLDIAASKQGSTRMRGAWALDLT